MNRRCRVQPVVDDATTPWTDMGAMGITEAAEKFAAMPSNRHLFRDQCLRVEVDAEGVVFHMIVRRDEAYWCENPRSGDPRKLVSQ